MNQNKIAFYLEIFFPNYDQTDQMELSISIMTFFFN